MIQSLHIPTGNSTLLLCLYLLILINSVIIIYLLLVFIISIYYFDYGCVSDCVTEVCLQLTAIVQEKVENKAEYDKYQLYVSELGKVMKLLLQLSGRLARANNAINALAEGDSKQKVRASSSTISALAEGGSKQKVRASSSTISALAEGGSKQKVRARAIFFTDLYFIFLRYVIATCIKMTGRCSCVGGLLCVAIQCNFKQD